MEDRGQGAGRERSARSRAKTHPFAAALVLSVVQDLNRLCDGDVSPASAAHAPSVLSSREILIRGVRPGASVVATGGPRTVDTRSSNRAGPYPHGVVHLGSPDQHPSLGWHVEGDGRERDPEDGPGRNQNLPPGTGSEGPPRDAATGGDRDQTRESEDENGSWVWHRYGTRAPGIIKIPRAQTDPFPDRGIDPAWRERGGRAGFMKDARGRCYERFVRQPGTSEC
jgi:hypothetical protein